MKLIYLLPLLFIFIIYGCNTVRESAGVNRKNIDESTFIENPPLIIPPDFNILPPDQLEAKDIEGIEKDLAQEILFGLDNQNVSTQTPISTMNQILSKAEADKVSSSIRNQIDQDFAQELQTADIFQVTWGDETEVLDAVKESERIRNKKFEGKSISEGEVPIKLETIKKKKDKRKKRFFFF